MANSRQHHPVTNLDLLSRVSVVESSLMGMRDEIRSIATAVNEFRSAEEERQRTPWANILSAAGLSVIIIAAIGSAFISPLSVRLAYQEKLNDAERQNMSLKLTEDFGKDTSIMAERLREIETQINWVTDIENIHKRHVNQWLAILWKNSFHTELPVPTTLTDGPSKQKPTP